jgi:hypothetical protein
MIGIMETHISVLEKVKRIKSNAATKIIMGGFRYRGEKLYRKAAEDLSAITDQVLPPQNIGNGEATSWPTARDDGTTPIYVERHVSDDGLVQTSWRHTYRTVHDRKRVITRVSYQEQEAQVDIRIIDVETKAVKILSYPNVVRPEELIDRSGAESEIRKLTEAVQEEFTGIAMNLNAVA